MSFFNKMIVHGERRQIVIDLFIIKMANKHEVDITIKIDLANLQRHVKASTSGHSGKVKVNLSVSNLAYLVKVLCESGVIKTRNISEVLRFVAEGFSTPGADAISFDSLRMKYYNLETSSKKSVKDLILKLLKYIQKDIGHQ